MSPRRRVLSRARGPSRARAPSRTDPSRGRAPSARPRGEGVRRAAPNIRRMAAGLARVADEKIGKDTKVLDLRGLTFITDYIVITTASSPPHAKAIAEAVERAVREEGGTLHHREGDHQSPWLLLDCHEVIVHVFSAEARSDYDLEQLWADAPRIKWRTGARKALGKLK